MSYVCFETQLFGLEDKHPSTIVSRAKYALAREFCEDECLSNEDINVHLVECSGNWEGLNFENA